VLPNVSIKVKKKKLHLCIVQQYIYLINRANKQTKKVATFSLFTAYSA